MPAAQRLAGRTENSVHVHSHGHSTSYIVSYIWTDRQERGRTLTGAVVDAGDSCTSCVPVVDGYVLGGALRSLPVAGRDVTRHVQKLLRCAPQDVRVALLWASAVQGTQIARHSSLRATNSASTVGGSAPVP